MATTPVYALPFPIGTDLVRDGDNVIQALAQQVETLLPGIANSRNQIRNGDFQIAQRGRGGFNGLGSSYTIDGVVATGVGGAFSVASNPVPPGTVGGARWSLTSTISGQSAVGDYGVYVLSVEDVIRLAGRQVTLSFSANASSGTPKIGVEVGQSFGTGGSTVTPVPVSAVPISTAATRYALTFTIASAVGKTLGTTGDCTQVFLWLSSGGTNAARASNIGIQNNTISLYDIQLEIGPTTTPFERLPIHQQLSWCLRYFWRATGMSSYGRYGCGVGLNTTQASCLVAFPMQMRVTPTMSVSNPGHFILYNGSATPICTALALDSASPFDFNFVVTVPASIAASQAIQLCQNATNPSYIDFTAEL